MSKLRNKYNQNVLENLEHHPWDRVIHPVHGHGRVIDHDGKKVVVDFDNGHRSSHDHSELTKGHEVHMDRKPHEFDEHADFPGLNKINVEKMPKPKVIQPVTITTGSPASNDGKINGPAKGEGIGESLRTPPKKRDYHGGYKIGDHVVIRAANHFANRAHGTVYAKFSPTEGNLPMGTLGVRTNVGKGEVHTYIHHKNLEHAKPISEGLNQSLGIGDRVRLHKPINGNHYGTVHGWTYKKVTGMHAGVPTGSVAHIRVAVHSKHNNGSVYDPVHDVKHKHLTAIDRYTGKDLPEAYVAPNTGNNNYAQNLPAGTTKGRVKAKLDKRDQASIADTMQESKSHSSEKYFNMGFSHGHSNLPKDPVALNHPKHAQSYLMGHSSGAAWKSVEQSEHLRAMAALRKTMGESVTEHPAPESIAKLSHHDLHSMFHYAAASQGGTPKEHAEILAKAHGKPANHYWDKVKHIKESLNEVTKIPGFRGKKYSKNELDTWKKHVKKRGLVHYSGDNGHHQAMSGYTGKNHGSFIPGSGGILLEDVITSLDDLQPIFESFVFGLHEMVSLAYKHGYKHGMQGHEIPVSASSAKFGEHAMHYHAGVKAGEMERARIATLNHGHSLKIGVAEELKVGDDGQEQKKVRGTNTTNGKVGTVKRKYLGNSRGTTATGKPAHSIDVQPVIGNDNKNVNKTTPSGERKRS